MNLKLSFALLGVAACSFTLNAQWTRSTSGTPRQVYLSTTSDQVGIGTTTPGTGIKFKVTNQSQMDSLYLKHANAFLTVRTTASSGYDFVNVTPQKISIGTAVSGPASLSLEAGLVSVSSGSSGSTGKLTGGKLVLKYTATSSPCSTIITYSKIVVPSLYVGNSDVNIGSCKLAVEGKIGAREVVVTTASAWPDYVFKPDYNLKPLAEVEQFINDNSHLEGIPTATDVKNNGVSLGEMQATLLQKVEELTLYMIEQNKKIESLNDSNTKLQEEIAQLKSN